MRVFARKLLAAAMLVVIGVAGAFGGDPGSLLAHQLDSPAAGALPPAPADPASTVGGLPAPQAPEDGDLPGVPGVPAGSPTDAPDAGARVPPAPAIGLPVASAPGLPALPMAPLPAPPAGVGPHDALLAATGSASGLQLAGATDSDPLARAPEGTPMGALADADALVSGEFDVMGNLQRPLLEAAKAQGLAVRRAVAPPLPDDPAALENAVLHLYRSIGFDPTAEQRVQLREDALGLDRDLALGTAVIVEALAKANEVMARVIGKLTTEEYQLLLACGAPSAGDPYAYPCPDPLRAIAVAQTRLDRAAMAEAALTVLAAVEQAQPRFDAFNAGRLEASAAKESPAAPESPSTADGGGDGSQHDDEDLFADPTRLIQVGGFGNDVYYGNTLFEAAGMPGEGTDSTVQVLTIDFSGEDLYLARAGGTSPSPAVPARSGASSLNDLLPHQDLQRTFGTFAAMSVDSGGNDYYSGCQVTCQGAGYLGIGVLIEAGGNDQYTAASSSQGNGDAGVGLLFDAAGDDVYTSRYRSQGHGQLAGIGELLDAGGNDRYTGEMLMQGAADGGGLGMLLDGGGDDRYSALATGPSLSQGGALTGGFGLFADGGGSDTYTSSKESQGAVLIGALPLSVGTALFLDRGGILDQYSVPPRTTTAVVERAPTNNGDWRSGTLGKGFDLAATGGQ